MLFFCICLIVFISCVDNTYHMKNEDGNYSSKNKAVLHDIHSQRVDTLKFFPNENDKEHFVEVISLDTIRLSTNKFSVLIVNHLRQHVYAGQSAYFEKQNGSNWFRIDFNKIAKSYIIVSNAVGYDLEPTERIEISHFLFNEEYEYVEGIYRICFFIKIGDEKEKRKICKNFYLISD